MSVSVAPVENGDDIGQVSPWYSHTSKSIHRILFYRHIPTHFYSHLFGILIFKNMNIKIFFVRLWLRRVYRADLWSHCLGALYCLSSHLSIYAQSLPSKRLQNICQPDRQMGRQTDVLSPCVQPISFNHIDRRKDRQGEKLKDWQTEINVDWHTYRHIGWQTYTQAPGKTDKQADRQPSRQADRKAASMSAVMQAVS